MTQCGIVLGRFQPLHLGHVEYLEAAKSHCDRLFIGITNPDAGQSMIQESDTKRSRSENNPFSYIDRHLMIERSLLEMNWSSQDFCIMAAPITDPARLVSYLPTPEFSEFFVTIYDDWGEQKAEELRSLGYPTTILWRRTYDERLTSGTYIREAIRTGGSWHDVVPKAVASYITEHGLEKVIGVPE